MFGKEMAPLSNLAQDHLVRDRWIELWVARIRLDQMCAPGTPLLRSSLRAASALSTAITVVVPRDLSNFQPQDGAVIGWQASTISTCIQQLESVLQNDMPDIAAYVVSQKGIYRTEDLITHAELQLTAATRAMLPAQAEFDIQQA